MAAPPSPSPAAPPDYFTGRSTPRATRPPPTVHQRMAGTPGSPRTPLLARSISAQFPGTPGSFRGSEPEDIFIYELGARHISAGFAGESRARCVVHFTPEMGRRVGDYRQYDPRYDRRNVKPSKRKAWGEDHELYSTLDLRNQDLGLVTDKLERAVRIIHAEHLQLDAKPLKAVLVVPSLLPTPFLEVALKVLFSHHTQPPSIAILTTPILATVAAGLRDALVVEVGWEETVVTAVGECKAVYQRRSVRAGKMMVEEMAKVLGKAASQQSERVRGEEVQISFEHAEDVVERMGWCRPRLSPEIAPGTLDAVKRIPLPFSHSNPVPVSLKTLCSPAETVLFAPTISRVDHDDEDLSLPKLAHAVVLTLPSDVRASCVSRIILTGGLSSLPGLKPRLLSELHQLVEQNRDWDRVASYGSATTKRDRVLRERSANTLSNTYQQRPPDSTTRARSPSKKSSTQDPSLPPSQRPHDDTLDPISVKAERNHNLGRNPHKQDARIAEVRGVETLGTWAGASLVARLGVKGVHEVERDDFLKYGVGGGGGGVY
ncbi:hypothetical protein B0A55_07583 [Friedmanniomyces simplex]|uniref:Actin-like ATPase domain-containing protein n=1 Tax=Friedmanniomyces simplex TaxID=329884 RepID=A0A4U0X6G5_9PEZI|nr:hypothetical protein B0A55_07583 [Friedmanniomyces simplex]